MLAVGLSYIAPHLTQEETEAQKGEGVCLELCFLAEDSGCPETPNQTEASLSSLPPSLSLLLTQRPFCEKGNHFTPAQGTLS